MARETIPNPPGAVMVYAPTAINLSGATAECLSAPAPGNKFIFPLASQSKET